MTFHLDIIIANMSEYFCIYLFELNSYGRGIGYAEKDYIFIFEEFIHKRTYPVKNTYLDSEGSQLIPV